MLFHVIMDYNTLEIVCKIYVFFSLLGAKQRYQP